MGNNGNVAPEEHVIRLEGVLNLRELGGYPVPDGGETQLRRLLRSDDLVDLTPLAQRFLIDYGLRTVIDLRDPEELERAPDPFAVSREVRYLHLPFFDDSGHKIGSPDMSQTMDLGYLHWLEVYPANVKAIFQSIVAADEGCTLIHCVAGKDRTGTVAGIMLALAAVADDVIIDDYAISYPLLYEAADRPQQQAVQTTDDKDRAARRRARMQQLLDGLRERFGGPVEYLRHIGLTDAETGALATRLTG